MSKLRLLISVALTACAITACGGAPKVTTDDGSKNSKESTSSASDADGGADGGSVGSGKQSGKDEGNQFVTDDSEKCEPASCEELDADCGKAADGCGGIIECGDCKDGEVCGLHEHNVCGDPAADCVPQKKSVVCEGKECGTEGDGCGGKIECGTCADGETCGAKEAFQCGVGGSESCAAKVESCADVGVECGKVGDGCGGTLDCDEEFGGCPDGQVCGVGGEQICGEPTACVPLDVSEACDGKCGFVSNGCGAEVDGGLIQCPGCPDGEACGASGVPNVCGNAADACKPVAQADACDGLECGVVGDGCSDSYDCGACGTGEICQQGACAPICTPTPQADACNGLECGLVSDGCGGSYSCGTCAETETCGVITAFQCDPTPPTECVPSTAQEACADKECGTVFDGCGTDPANQIDCTTVSGGCQSGEYCGAVEAFQCDPPGGSQCTAAASCAELGWECGIAIDDCGNVFDCAAEGRTCQAGVETCVGGINSPTQCLGGGSSGGIANCDVCDAIPDCSAEAQVTELTGRVITAGRNDAETGNQVAIPNAFVYILRNNDETELPDISSGIPNGGTSCDRCEDQDLGPILVGATTNSLGEFTLSGNIPVGKEFVLVVKIGKWRRAVKYTVDAGDSCATSTVDIGSTRLPRSMADGLGANIPRIAISTGQIDAMECVFEKMGVSTGEFAEPGNNGANTERVHMYRANGAKMSSGSTADSELYGSLTRMSLYDMVVFACEGGGYADHNTSDPNVREYVNRGGRMFASHLSFTWIDDNGSQSYSAADPYDTGLSGAANWGGSVYATPATGTGIVSTARPMANPAKIQNFADWLVNESAATLNGGSGLYTFNIDEPRDLALSVNTGSEEFVYRTDGNPTPSVQQFSFNTPFGAPDDAICGRVAYSGFHVYAGGGSYDPFKNVTFPDHCSGTLTSQEKVLLYMLFDLGSCVTTGEVEPPACTPVADCTGRCGNLPDGCGGIVSCSCQGADSCLSGGICGIPACVPTTCAAQGATCGNIADGCGGILNCGTCPSGSQCGLTTANQCSPTCTPNDKATACAGKCGFVSDGCGGVHECPGCDGSLSCVAGVCTSQTCTPKACPAGAECGIVSDGCSGFVNCGTCQLPEVCGGAGVANECGAPQCPALTCQDLDAECGWIGDGCGGSENCGTCPAGQVCTSVGGKNRCTGCTPLTCQDVGAQCGAIGDGCGNIIQCGTCPSGQSCGAVTANQCGPTGNCTPRTCGQAQAECGLIGDGCGGTVDCGKCPGTQICGIVEAFKCDEPPDCQPSTCASVGAECGAIADGCGGLVDCGPCGAGETCGINTPNQCGSTGVAK